ncbi:MAG: LptF/LptG family permease [Prochloraceae cyanobacterium]|nr:LptF/LptG family permease [Prochloraceae cyanobacterium]
MEISKAKLKSIAPFPNLLLIDRYLLKELILPFVFGMGLFSSLGIAVGTLFDLIRQVSESQVLLAIALQVLFLKMPEFVAYGIPMSVLLATLMTYSRLSQDSELIAMRCIGVSLYRLVVPAIVFSAIIMGITFLFQESIVPAANYQSSIILERAIADGDAFSSKQENILYPQYQQVLQPNGQTQRMLTRIFYAEEFDNERMQELTVLDLSGGGIDRIVIAKSATSNPQTNSWDFFDGYTYLINPDGSYGSVVRFEKQTLQIPRDRLNLADRSLKYDEMNISRARTVLKSLESSGDEKAIRQLKVRIQEKLSFPFICLVFGLVGAGLGSRLSSGGKGINFGICLLIIFGYYLLAFITSSLGMSGTLPPVISAWLPNVFVLIAGSIILVKVSG